MSSCGADVGVQSYARESSVMASHVGGASAQLPVQSTYTRHAGAADATASSTPESGRAHAGSAPAGVMPSACRCRSAAVGAVGSPRCMVRARKSPRAVAEATSLALGAAGRVTPASPGVPRARALDGGRGPPRAPCRPQHRRCRLPTMRPHIQPRNHPAPRRRVRFQDGEARHACARGGRPCAPTRPSGPWRSSRAGSTCTAKPRAIHELRGPNRSG